jgi:hypothetical protein
LVGILGNVARIVLSGLNISDLDVTSRSPACSPGVSYEPVASLGNGIISISNDNDGVIDLSADINTSRNEKTRTVVHDGVGIDDGGNGTSLQPCVDFAVSARIGGRSTLAILVVGDLVLDSGGAECASALDGLVRVGGISNKTSSLDVVEGSGKPSTIATIVSGSSVAINQLLG